jgi:S1-C subfamily serine protease
LTVPESALGVDVKRVVKELAERYGAVAGHGLWVKKVHRDSAAEKAGIKVGDIIVRANRQKIRLISDLRQVLNALDDKEAVVLEVEEKKRDGALKYGNRWFLPVLFHPLNEPVILAAVVCQ